MRLHEISEALEEALKAVEVDENTGEVKGYETVDALQISFTEKVEGLACYIKDHRAFEDALLAEIARLEAKVSREKSIIESGKMYLTNCMMSMGMKKHDSEKCTISFLPKDSLKIDDESLIPDDFFNEKTTVTRKADKTRIKKAISEGVDVPGVHIDVNQNIQIK